MAYEDEVVIRVNANYPLESDVPPVVVALATKEISVKRERVAQLLTVHINNVQWEERQNQFDDALADVARIFRTIDEATSGARNHNRFVRIALVPSEGNATLAISPQQLAALTELGVIVHLDAWPGDGWEWTGPI